MDLYWLQVLIVFTLKIYISDYNFLLVVLQTDLCEHTRSSLI